MTGPLQVLNVEELLLVGAALLFKGLNDVLDSGVVDTLVLSDPHLVLLKDLEHVNTCNSVTMTDLFVHITIFFNRTFTLLNHLLLALFGLLNHGFFRHKYFLTLLLLFDRLAIVQ
jgi:hypothetical protein